MPLTAPFFTFAFVFTIAFLMPLFALLAPSLRFPTAILEIFCGVLVGRGGFYWIATPDWLHVVTKIGLLFLMFLAGLEIRFPSKRSRPQSEQRREAAAISGNAVLLAGAMLIATFALALAAGQWLEHLQMATNARFVALIFATTSLGIVVPILKETGLSTQPLGQTLLLSALFADFGTVALIPFVLQPDATAGSPLQSLLLLLAIGAILYLLGRIALRFIHIRDRIVRVSQLGVRGSLAIMAICGGVALALHAEIILGGFIAGLVCSLLAGNQHEVLRGKLEVLGYSLFLPLFFITVGMDLDVSHIHFSAVMAWLPLYVLCAFLVKWGAALTIKPWFSWRETFAAGALMSTRFTLVLAVTLTAEQAHRITGTEGGVLMATALATVLIAPMLFTILLPQTFP